MIRYSARTYYALRATLELARVQAQGNNLITLHGLATTCDIPEKFLVSVLSLLRRAHIVESIRGKEGGYRLAAAPDAIRIGDIVRASESADGAAPPRPARNSRVASEETFLEGIRRRAETAAYDELDAVTLLNVLESAGGSTPRMYYI